MLALIRLYTDIALLRRGPEHVPAAPWLLAATIMANFIVSFGVSMILPPFDGPWHLHLLLDIAFTLAWYFLLLRVFGKPERFLQTTTAVFGYQMVLAPVWIAVAWLANRFQTDDFWVLPIAILGLGMLAWVLAANGRILNSSLEQPMAICIALVLLQVIVGYLMVLAVFAPAART